MFLKVSKDGFTPFNCGKALHKAMKYSISTSTRYLINASSEKKGAKESLVSISSVNWRIAFNSFKVVIFVVCSKGTNKKLEVRVIVKFAI
jgi:hypothetical protein